MTLRGLERSLGIEDAAQLRHRDQIGGRKQQRHLAHFLDADAMLAGEAAAQLDACGENFAAGFDRMLHLAGDAFIIEHDRMDVAVAGVKDVSDREAVAFATA